VHVRAAHENDMRRRKQLGAPPVARIVSLAVLGVTFYAGGMLYQRMLVAKQP